MPLTAQAPSLDPLTANKQTVREFYDLAFAQRRPNDGAARCFALQPSTLTRRMDSAQSYVVSVVGWLDSLPRLNVEVLRVVAEGDLVAVQSAFTPAPGEPTMLVMDLFRLRGGRIVEHWDPLHEADGRDAQASLVA